MDVDVAIFARFVVIFLSVEPEDAGEDQILFFHWVGGFPDTARGFASNKVGSGFGAVADLLTDPMPAERGFVAVGVGTGAFLAVETGKERETEPSSAMISRRCAEMETRR